MEVEVREEAVSTPSQSFDPGDPAASQLQKHPHILEGSDSANNTPPYPVQDSPVLIVRPEEVLLVVLVLILWVAAIALFFNRWGKIRMLEPYQPKFQQSHRPSCPLAPLSPPGITPQQRMSFSKYNVSCFTDTIYGGISSPNPPKRPRLNSVFVQSSAMAVLNPPRRVKSAMDIQHLIINENRPRLSGFNSMLPISLNIGNKDRRPSITVERPSSSRHRPSISVERPYLTSHYQPQLRSNRRSSCFVGIASSCKSTDRHKNFLSFEQSGGFGGSSSRRKSISVERPSCSFHHQQQPTISFETSTTTSSSFEQPTVIIERPPQQPKMSKSFETPKALNEKPPTRLSTSLDVNPLSSFERKMSIPEEEIDPPVIITLEDMHLEEAQITAPLLEGLKSSDV